MVMNSMTIKRLASLILFLIIAFTATPVLLRSEAPTLDGGASMALSNLAVPEELGKVQERFAGNAGAAGRNPSRTIIQIQDVHAHTAAQQNIAAILERLRVVFGIEKAALEGAWISTSLPKSHGIPTSREKQLLAGTLLEDDRISGPIYAAIMSPQPITLAGIEEEPLYEKNRALFLAHLDKTNEIDTALQAYGASLQESQRSVWGPELSVFGNAFGKFRDTSDLGKFFPLLWKTAETQGADISDLTQVTLVQDILSQEKLFQKERLEQEIKQLMREYKNTPWTIEELIRGGRIPAERLGFYPELKKMIRLYQLRDRVSLGDLTAQIEILTGRVIEKLIRTPEEKSLWEKSERFHLARRILLLQASPADIKAYEREKILLEPELTGAGLSEVLSLSLDFYEAVKERDEIFFNRLVNDPSLSGNIAIITGGFHTDGLSQRFRDAGISYITITPELGDTPANEKLYNERMRENRDTKSDEQAPDTLSGNHSPGTTSAGGQTLSELRNAPATVDENFPPAFEILKQTKDVRKAKARFSGNIVTVSPDERISNLHATGRIRQKTAGPSLAISDFRKAEFMALPRTEQREAVERLIEQAGAAEQKVMLISSVSALQKLFQADARSETRVEELVKRGDMLALLQDVPAAKVPEALLAPRGIERFEAENMAALLGQNLKLRKLAKRFPFVVMQTGYGLPEQYVWLVLYRALALNPNLYHAAKNPEFLALLQNLVTEILSRELPKKSV